MPKRKKRLRRGIESIVKQIDVHEKKLEEAKKAGNIGLTEYYEKEIETLRSAVTRKQRAIDRKQR